MKWYIREWTEQTDEGEELQVCIAYESMINDLSYIVFVEK
jgi:hypothetical protein